MRTRALVNFAVPPEKKAEYKAACEILGISMTEVCIKALDNSIALAKKIQPGEWKQGEPDETNPDRLPEGTEGKGETRTEET